MTTTTDFAPVHPGEILNTEFLEPLGISQYRIAKAIDVHPRRINEIVHGKRRITADTGLRLARALGVGDMFFINMQSHYDAELARDELAEILRLIDPVVHHPTEKGVIAEENTRADEPRARVAGKAFAVKAADGRHRSKKVPASSAPVRKSAAHKSAAAKKGK